MWVVLALGFELSREREKATAATHLIDLPADERSAQHTGMDTHDTIWVDKGSCWIEGVVGLRAERNGKGGRGEPFIKRREERGHHWAGYEGGEALDGGGIRASPHGWMGWDRGKPSRIETRGAACVGLGESWRKPLLISRWKEPFDSYVEVMVHGWFPKTQEYSLK